MSVSGGSQSGKQSGSQSGQQSGTNDTASISQGQTINSGVTTGQQVGTQTGQQTGQNTVDTTAGWDSISSLLQGMLSGGGVTPQQQVSADNILTGAQNTGNNIDYAGKVLSQYVGDNHPAYQIADAEKIIAPTGAGYISDYTNPFENQVVDATRNDLTQGFKTGLNELRASYGGQFGNGREGVAAGTAADNFDRTLGTTLGGLRSANYGTAVQAGQGDAARQLQANTSNVDNGIRVNQFNTGQKNINDAQSIGAVNDWVSQQIAKNGIVSDANAQRGATSQQGIGNLLGFLSSQNPAFGSSSTGAQSGTQSGQSIGTSDSTTQTQMEQLMRNIFSGQSSGTSSGSSSSKGGGASIPIIG